MMENVRVRFAPSPTGGLHIGGVRTALFNYLFARKYNGKFILRIEDTDQARLVPGAESYIKEALNWCNINPDEGPDNPGEFGPYRQSERKDIYRQYAEQLVQEGNAYYAFDTPEELEAMRERLKEARVVNPQYDTVTRTTMKNSLTLSQDEVKQRIENGDPYVIRIKIPKQEEVRLNDLVRGWVMVHTEVLDDKVLMKSDGMPTYHLANIVDDHLMKITHVIRGEEWLPSAPLHVLLYRFLGWEETMPKFAHLPLILKPDGNGKLSKRAADKAGFPIFPLNWKDPESSETSAGFKEIGFLPEALINFLAFLGWNPGTEQEIFSLEELIQEFTGERINKAGTKFDFDKAKWFNQQYVKNTPAEQFIPNLIETFQHKHNIICSEKTANQIIELLRERVTFPSEFAPAGLVLFDAPEVFDRKIVEKKWDEEAGRAMAAYAEAISANEDISAESAKNLFWTTLESMELKPGKYMQALRLALTGQGSGPDLMGMIEIMGGKSAAERIKNAVDALNNLKQQI